MTTVLLPGVPDEALLHEMTVYVDPLKTEARYQPGVKGVAASLISLECVVFGSDWQSISSVLGDMAMCMQIKCLDVPKFERFEPGELQSLFSDLERALDDSNERLVRSLIAKMLRAAGLTQRESRRRRFPR